jgi:membrane protease YdiL (CAAX protease family)
VSIKRFPVATYLALTVGLSVLVFLIPAPDEGTLLGLLLLTTLFPAAVAIGLTWFLDGRSGAAHFIRESFHWRSPLLWYLVAIGLGFLIQLGSSILALLLGQISTLEIRPPLAVVVAFVLFALLEEIGWRGFAQRRLMRQYNLFVAVLIVGAAWGLLHMALAAFTLTDRSPIAEGLAVLAAAFPIGWVFLRSGGSVLVATIAHFVYNASGSVIGPSFALSEGDTVWLLAASTAIIAAALVVVDWRRWFRPPSGVGTTGNDRDLAFGGSA